MRRIGFLRSAFRQLARAGLAAPGGGVFSFLQLGRVALNDEGDAAFAFALDPFTLPVGNNSGVYRFPHNRPGRAIVVPGVTRSPTGGVFFGSYFNSSMNNEGEVGFTGMISASIGPGAPIGLGMGAFRADPNGEITTIAAPGDPAPGGSVFDFVIHPWINDEGDVAFDAHISADECIPLGQRLPFFIFCASRPGDPMPGGGNMVRAPFNVTNFHINNPGTVVFAATLDSDDNGDGILDTGLFVWRRGNLGLVARTGTTIPGIGTVAHLQPPSLVGRRVPNPGAVINDRGEILFQVTLSDGRGVLLIATP